MRKIPNINLLAAVFCVLISCSKNSGGGKIVASSTEYNISGTAYVTNLYKDSIYPLKNTLVFIGYDTTVRDTSDYFYSVPTDSKGNFAFYVTSPDSVYRLFASPVIKSSPSFSAGYYGLVKTVVPYNSTMSYQLIVAIDSTSQNGIDFTVLDSHGQAIPGATLILYSSRIVAAADSTFTGKGSIVSLTSDSTGKGLATQLPPDSVFINAFLKIDDKTTLKDIVEAEAVRPAGIIMEKLVLK